MSATTPGSEVAIPSPVDRFLGRLEAADAGERARLKRNAGQPLAGARGVLPLFYTVADPILPAVQYDGLCSLRPRSHREQRRSFLRAGRTLSVAFSS